MAVHGRSARRHTAEDEAVLVAELRANPIVNHLGGSFRKAP
jgi:hypothetical protein